MSLSASDNIAIIECVYKLPNFIFCALQIASVADRRIIGMFMRGLL